MEEQSSRKAFPSQIFAYAKFLREDAMKFQELDFMKGNLTFASVGALNEVGPGNADKAFEVGSKHARIRWHALDSYYYYNDIKKSY